MLKALNSSFSLVHVGGSSRHTPPRTQTLNKLAFLMPLLFASCVNLNEDAVVLKLESEPPGALASIQEGPSCQTPCQVPLAPTHRFLVTFSKPGCHDKVLLLEPHGFQGIALGPIIGIGSQLNFDPNPAKALLQCENNSPAPGNASKLE